jgi:hypothetical protein
MLPDFGNHTVVEVNRELPSNTIIKMIILSG